MQPTKETETLARLVEILVSRYQEIESSLPLLSRELAHSERKALKVVNSAGKITIGKIGAALGAPPSTTTWIVTGLVKRDIFRREPDKKDRRKTWIALSDKGEALARLMERIPDRIAADLLYKLPQERREEFMDLVRGALEKIDEAGSFK